MVLRYIILGLLSKQSMTGYDLKLFFNKVINFFWTAELSQIYRELGKLETDGCITHETILQEGKPDKKLYSITDYGNEQFINWLSNYPDSIIQNSRNEFLVRIFFSSKLPKEDLLYQLRKYLNKQKDELDIYLEILERFNKSEPLNNEQFYEKMTLNRGIHFAQSEIKWIEESINDLLKR